MTTPDGRELTIRAWEQRLGREGCWCRSCRRLTPVSALVLLGQAAALRCEDCRGLLVIGDSCLGPVDHGLRSGELAVDVSDT